MSVQSPQTHRVVNPAHGSTEGHSASELNHPAGQLAQAYVESGEFGVWKESFDTQTQHSQLEDDHIAWHNVTGLLIAIVSVGLVLAVTALTLCTNIAL